MLHISWKDSLCLDNEIILHHIKTDILKKPNILQNHILTNGAIEAETVPAPQKWKYTSEPDLVIGLPEVGILPAEFWWIGAAENDLLRERVSPRLPA